MQIAKLSQLTKRYLQWSHRKTVIITNCTQLQQPRRKTSRQNVCVHDQRSDSHWWHQSASHKWSRKHQFDINFVDNGVAGYWGLLS